MVDSDQVSYCVAIVAIFAIQFILGMEQTFNMQYLTIVELVTNNDFLQFSRARAIVHY
jgi:hypothetical protein